MIWSARPFVRILLFFILGIIISKYIAVISTINEYILLTISVILLLFATVIAASNLKHKYLPIAGFLFGILITITGILITSQNSISENELTPNINSQAYLANIISNPTETNQSVKAILSIISVKSDSSAHSNPKKILCYFAKDSLSSNLIYGDVITFRSNLTKPKKPLNPDEFDYADYLIQNGITYTSYIKTKNWKLIDYEPINPIIAIAGKIRLKLLNTLSNNGLSGNDYAVAAAILLGYDDFMEANLKQDYVMAGAMHILCVSGLHVGIIFLVISFMLSFLKNTRFNNILKAIILTISVWAYATITGLSPSVQRASLMLTVFIIGNVLNRNRDTYNTLAISALILLIINPLLIFNVGFQLSYAAVIGIITFHQPIYKLLYFKNAIADKIWSITVLSFAAQLATFPIATYYFHFFPPWFWLTNLFTFPLSFLIIAMGLMFVITMWIPVIPKLIGAALSGMIYLLNYVVGTVKYLPFSGIDYIYTSIPMLFSIYLLLLLAFLMFTKKKLKLLLPVLIIFSVIIGLSTYHKYGNLTQKKIIIYSIKKHSVYDFIDGNQHVLITDSTLINNTLDYQLKNSRAKWGIDNFLQAMPANDTLLNNQVNIIDNFLLFKDLRIFIADGSKNYYPTQTKIQLDLLIISGNKKTDINKLLSVFDISKVVIDSSVPYWNQKTIETILKKEGIICHNVNKNGALIMEL